MKDNRFNILSTQLKNTTLKSNQFIDEEAEQQPQERLTSVGYTRMKRKYNDLETYTARSEMRPLNVLGTTTTIYTKPNRSEVLPIVIPKEEREKAIMSKPVVSGAGPQSKVKSIDTLEKYFYMDERIIETDKNIGNMQSPSTSFY
jgi:hypothetical protein